MLFSVCLMNCRYSMSPVLGLSVMITGMYCLSLFRRGLQLSWGQIISRKVSEGRGSEYPESGAGRRKGGFRRGSFWRRPGAWYYLGTFSRKEMSSGFRAASGATGDFFSPDIRRRISFQSLRPLGLQLRE